MELEIKKGNYSIYLINFDGNHQQSYQNEYNYVLRIYASNPVIIEQSIESELDLTNQTVSAFSKSMQLCNSNYCNWLIKKTILSTTIPVVNSKSEVIDLTDDSEEFSLNVESNICFNLLIGLSGLSFLVIENLNKCFLTLQIVVRTKNLRTYYDDASKVKTSNITSSSDHSSRKTIKNYTESKILISVPPKSLNLLCYLIKWPKDENGKGMIVNDLKLKIPDKVVIHDVTITNLNEVAIERKIPIFNPISL